MTCFTLVEQRNIGTPERKEANTVADSSHRSAHTYKDLVLNRASLTSLCGFLAVFSAGFGHLAAASVAVPQSDEGRKLALVIAISDYGDPGVSPVTGEPMRRYRNLNAMNDVPLIRGVLEVQGFQDENIRVVQDADADADGIRAAFRWLTREAEEGDVVVFHYSGHGHRMTNDNPEEDEETDGYDAKTADPRWVAGQRHPMRTG